MKRPTILIVFGGESSEHDISVRSAKNVFAAIDKYKYDTVLGYIDHNGRWWLLNSWTDTPDDSCSVQLVVAPGTSTVLTIPGSRVIHIDVLFPILHGKHGEDGTIQGLAQIAHVPIVGCDVEASAICMDKNATKQLLEGFDIPVVPWRLAEHTDDKKSVIKKAKAVSKKGPWFVKPSRAGSSLGVTKVSRSDELFDAVLLALGYDNLVIIEPAIKGRELEVAVMGNPPNHKTSGVGEIIPGRDFYDYDEKYSSDSMSKVILDAQLSKPLTKTIRKYAADTYEMLGCRGLARVDFFLDEKDTPYVNEINTMPGFTDISMYPKLWIEEDISYESLVDQLIELALE